MNSDESRMKNGRLKPELRTRNIERGPGPEYRLQAASTGGPHLAKALPILVFLLIAAPVFGGEIEIPQRPAPGQPAEKEPAEGKPVIVVFDFVSAYDGDRVGKFVGKNLWAKFDRTGKCSMVERDDLVAGVEQAKFVAGFDMKPADIVKFAAEKFGATHAVWGKVEQAGGEGLKVSARAAAVEDKGEKLLVDMNMEIKNQYVVQLATKEVVRLFFKGRKATPDVGPDEEKRWLTAPNLVKNPSFELGADHPQFWEPFGKSYHQGGVSWVASPEGKGKCIKFQMDGGVAGGPGVGYYGDPISIKDGTIYRFSVRVRADGPTVKIFLKHYKLFPPGPNEKEGQWRETRRAPLNCKGGERGKWKTYTRDFRPHRNDKHDPSITRVELYAYHPAGTVYFDDVVMKKLK